MKRIFFAIVLGISIYSQINAQLVTDRPDQTESSSTVGKGNLQVESGFLIGFEGDDQFSMRQILLPTNLFRYGVSKVIEVRFLSQFESLKLENHLTQGISDIEIGAKMQILNSGNNTEIAFLSHLIVPTGTKELTSDKFGTVNKLSVSHQLSENIGLGYNLGYNYFGSTNGDLTYSLVLGIGVNDKVGIYIEPFGEVKNFENFIINFDSGFTYLASENLQLDFSFGTGINNTMNYISLGCSWLIKTNN